ncbi:MAG: hypothetical protein FWF35_02360 [Elusimicrobia bacterium]|nr:hypothetical protein [Elusimicrobiota bacterium]
MKKLTMLFTAMILSISPVFAQGKNNEDKKLEVKMTLLYSLSREQFETIASMIGGAEWLKENGFPSLAEQKDRELKEFNDRKERHENCIKENNSRIAALKDSIQQREGETSLWTPSKNANLHDKNKKDNEEIKELGTDIKWRQDLCEPSQKNVKAKSVESIKEKTCFVFKDGFNSETNVLTYFIALSACPVAETLTFKPQTTTHTISTGKVRFMVFIFKDAVSAKPNIVSGQDVNVYRTERLLVLERNMHLQ